jgi:hypothetical protein
VTFNHDRREIQELTFLAQPDVVAHREFPGKLDGDAGADDDALPDFGTENRSQKTRTALGNGSDGAKNRQCTSTHKVSLKREAPRSNSGFEKRERSTDGILIKLGKLKPEFISAFYFLFSVSL